MPMFTPTRPFELASDGENYGNPGKYSAFARNVAEIPFQIGGIHCYIYRLEGTFDQKRDALNLMVDESGTEEGATGLNTFLGVQDPILGENRDRAYNFDEVPVIKGIYQISQSEMELLRFGFKSNETVSMEFHQGQVEKNLGRRFVEGDVIELPHLREVGLDGRVANKWYEVKSITWSPGGYDPTYQRHIVGVILQPLRHQQEFLDLFDNVVDQYGKTLAEQTSNEKQLNDMTDAIQTIAGDHASTTWWDTTIMWFDPTNPNSSPERFTDDGLPPNGEPVQQGPSFPTGGVEGDWHLRTDLVPNRLYQLTEGRWKLREIDIKRDWQPYNWVVQWQQHFAEPSDKSYTLHSIHDVITDREALSDPTRSRDI